MTLFRTNIRHLENITMIKYKKHIAEISVIAAPMVIGNLGHVLTGATERRYACCYCDCKLYLFHDFYFGTRIINGYLNYFVKQARRKTSYEKIFFVGGNIISNFGFFHLDCGFNCHIFYAEIRV